MALGSTQPLTEMSVRNLLNGKGGRFVQLSWTLLPCNMPLETSKPVYNLMLVHPSKILPSSGVPVRQISWAVILMSTEGKLLNFVGFDIIFCFILSCFISYLSIILFLCLCWFYVFYYTLLFLCFFYCPFCSWLSTLINKNWNNNK